MKFMRLVLLALTMVATAVACSDPYTATNGTATTMSVTQDGVIGTSRLTSYNAPDNNLNLGTVTIITGKLIKGSLTSTKLLQGGTFSSGNSTFTIVGNGTNGVPAGAIYTGMFTGTVQWFLTNTIWKIYALKGNVNGKLIVDGRSYQVKGTTAQCFVYTNGMFVLSGGLTNLNYQGE